jgi:hypothetical protein
MSSSFDHRAQELLREGAAILSRVLELHGFVLELGRTGNSSGGPYASAAYTRGNRRLEFHFRHSLGLVQYHIGNDSLEHETYMRLMKVGESCLYPDFSKDPLDSFRSLAADIQTYCTDFTSGDGEQFHVLAAVFKTDPTMFKGIR